MESLPERIKTDWSGHWRSDRALNETQLISGEICQLLNTLLSIQGLDSFCNPTIVDLARKFGTRRRVIKLLRQLETELPDIVTIERVGGSGPNRYHVTPKDKWPDELLKKWEGSKIHKWDGRPAQRRVPYGMCNGAKSTPVSGVKSTPRKPSTGAKTIPLLGDSMGEVNGASTKAVNKGTVQRETMPTQNLHFVATSAGKEFLCKVCKSVAPHGEGVKDGDNWYCSSQCLMKICEEVIP